LGSLSDNPSKLRHADQYCDPFRRSPSLRKPHFQYCFNQHTPSEIDLFKLAELTLPPTGAKPVTTYATLTWADDPLVTINTRTASPRACENRGQDEVRANGRREQRKLKMRKRKVVLSNGGPESQLSTTDDDVQAPLVAHVCAKVELSLE
jgi:hypothetical protein